MKKYIALFTALALACIPLLGGCTPADTSSAEVPQTQADPMPSGDMPAFPEGGFDGQMPGFPGGGFDGQMPGFPMGEGQGGDISYTPLVIETEDLFSDRDLNSSPDLSEAVSIAAKTGSEYTISDEGIYVLSGQAENFTVRVEADKKDKVQIVLSSAVISNDDFPVIYVKSADKCFVTVQGSNSLSVSQQFVSDADTNTDAVIFSKDDLTLNGTGFLKILSAAGNGITSKDDLKITGGTYDITSAKDAIEANDSISVYDGEFIINTNKDGFHCENDKQQGAVYIKSGSYTITAADDGIQATTSLVINGGMFDITAVEGMEATYVQINDGTIHINASDDGINAAQKSTELDVIIEINGGEITVVMGPGDTDGLDANGAIIVNGGTIDITGNSTFDADRGSVYNGGTIIINGTQTDSIPSSMMGGHGGMGNNGGGMQGGFGGRPDRRP